MKLGKLLRLCVAALGILTAQASQAAPADWTRVPNYQALYVFGDSLSDTGNDLILTRQLGVSRPVPPQSIYYEGRFSNGPVAFEYLWRRVARPGDLTLYPSRSNPVFGNNTSVSFAYGGSGSGGEVPGPGGFPVYGVLAQVEMFRQALNGKAANEQALYAVWYGANDYSFYSGQIPAVVRNQALAIETLYGLGARSFLVPNLPDMGLAPRARQQGLGEAFSYLVQQHNAALGSALDALAARLPGLRIVRVVVFSLTHELLKTYKTDVPALEVVAPGSGAAACLFLNATLCPTTQIGFSVPEPLLFWDVLHPTSQAHEQVANAMFEALALPR